ncbi:Bifunctional inhibitor/plant lipid transfer protein/seed storage helical domain [Dillenia turbinata]|uniref:Bifunctional inhibitor/plant lipid transfer protein/seed storage helical domain n=1 Tax=Dillenia turbinata TaxID=194707 RepID=A0AAN8W271_9MAGN
MWSKVAIVMLLLVVIAGSEAQSICNMTGEGLMACKPSVTQPNPTPPTPACCASLSHADLKCFCSYRNSKLLPALGIDPNLAMKLPENKTELLVATLALAPVTSIVCVYSSFVVARVNSNLYTFV